MIPIPYQQKMTPASQQLAIDWAKAPRALLACFVCNNPLFPNLVNGRSAIFAKLGTGLTQLGVSASGAGLATAVMSPLIAANNINAAYVSVPASINKVSVEALVCLTNLWSATALNSGCFCGQAQNTPAGANNQVLHIQYSTYKFGFWVYDGASKTALSTTTASAGKLFHLVGTADGTNVNIYINGVLEGQTAAGNAPAGPPATFAVGGCNNASITPNGPQCGSVNYSQILLCNYAGVAWSPGEVMQRFVNPFGFLTTRRQSAKTPVLGRSIRYYYDMNRSQHV